MINLCFRQKYPNDTLTLPIHRGFFAMACQMLYDSPLTSALPPRDVSSSPPLQLLQPPPSPVAKVNHLVTTTLQSPDELFEENMHKIGCYFFNDQLIVNGYAYQSLRNLAVLIEAWRKLADKVTSLVINDAKFPRGVLIPLGVECPFLSSIYIKDTLVCKSDIESMNSRSCPRLTELSLEGCELAQEATFAIPVQMPQLRSLQMGKIHTVSVAMFKAIYPFRTFNESLTDPMIYQALDVLTPSRLFAVIQKSSKAQRYSFVPFLKESIRRQTVEYTLEEIVVIMKLAVETQCVSLIHLCASVINKRVLNMEIDIKQGNKEIIICDGAESRSQPTVDEILKPIADRFRKLSCIGKGWTLPMILLRLKALPNVTQVTFEDCEELTNDMLKEIVTHFPLIAHLQLSSCSKITAEGIAQVKHPFLEIQVI